MMIKFVLVTRGRTGSTVVLDSLNKLNSVTALQEPFLSGGSLGKMRTPENREVYRYFRYLEMRSGWARLFSFLFRQSTLRKYLDILTQETTQQKKGAFGFKVLSHHFDQYSALAPVLRREGYRFIYLRRNPARQVVSGMVAAQLGEYNSRKIVKEHAPVVLDGQEFAEKVHGEEVRTGEDLERLKAWGVPMIELRYEDFLSDRDAFFRCITDFLGLPAERPPASEYKVMIASLEDSVANLDELKSIAATLGQKL